MDVVGAGPEVRGRQLHRRFGVVQVDAAAVLLVASALQVAEPLQAVDDRSRRPGGESQVFAESAQGERRAPPFGVHHGHQGRQVSRVEAVEVGEGVADALGLGAVFPQQRDGECRNTPDPPVPSPTWACQALRMERFDDATLDPQGVPGFSPPQGQPYVIELRQKVTMVKNVWGAFYVSPDGSEVQVAQVAQKRFKLKEAVNVETPDGDPLLTIKARNVFEVGGTYDVHDAAGNVLATLTKEFQKSLVRSTYGISTPLGELVAHERGAGRAVLRRLWSLTDFPWFLPIQFDIVQRASGGAEPVATIDRQMKLRDHYRIEVRDPRLDWRVATSIGIATDAFMNR